MDAEYQFMQFAAPILLLAGSLGIGYSMQYFGFSFHEYLERQLDFEERSRTELGRVAEPPRLITHARRRIFGFGLLSLPVLLNALVAAGLYWYDFPNLVLLAFIPILVIEWVAVRWLGDRITPWYQADLDRYFALTDPANRMVEATVRDYAYGLSPDEIASTRLLSGGSIITALVPAGNGRGEQALNLFQPSAVYIPKAAFLASPGSVLVRLYYRPERFVQGIAVDGTIVGIELLAPLPEPMSYDEYEAGLTVN